MRHLEKVNFLVSHLQVFSIYQNPTYLAKGT